MKKILLSLFLIGAIGSINQSRAQCSGATIVINNFLYLPGSGVVTYNYNWTYTQGNASIELVFLCNGNQVASVACIERLRDFPGTHNVSGSFVLPNTCIGTFRMLIKVWSNNSCGGTSCNDNTRDISNITLPVSLKSFSASRNNSVITIKWETSTEQNSRGFAVERNNGNGEWQEVAFVHHKQQVAIVLLIWPISLLMLIIQKLLLNTVSARLIWMARQNTVRCVQ